MSRQGRTGGEHPPALVRVAVIVVALLAAYLWLCLVASPYRLVRGLLDGGRRLQAAQSRLTTGKVGQAAPLVYGAEASVDTVRAELDSPGPLLDVASLVPQVRDALGELDHVVKAMELSTKAAVDTVAVVEDALRGSLIKKDPDDPKGSSIVDLERVDEAIDAIADAKRTTEAVITELEKIDLAKLPGRVRPRVTRAIADANDAIERIDVAQRGFAILPAVLGADGPRNYLLGFQNPAEQRGTGGAILQFKVLKFDRGRFELADIAGSEGEGTVYNIDQERQTYDIPLPPDAWLVSQIEDAQRFGNANWSPDWPLSAQLMIEYAYTSARVNPDLELPDFNGFIVVDPIAVQKMMPGVGTFTTKLLDDPITTRNVVPFVLYEAYGDYPNQGERRKALGQIVNQFFSKALGSPNLDELMQGVGESLTQKRIQIWMQDPDVQRFIKEMDWDGSIKQAKGSDFVYVVEQNVGGNKLDFFESQANKIDVTFEGQDALVSTEMRVRNGIFGPQPNWMVGDVGPLHRPMMSLYVPGDATLQSWGVDGKRLDSPMPAIWSGGRPPEDFESGKKVWTATLEIPAGEEAAVRYEYRVPAVVRARDDRSVYRLIVQSQPKVHPEELTITIALPEGASDVRAPGWQRDGDDLVWDKLLRRDMEFEISWKS